MKQKISTQELIEELYRRGYQAVQYGTAQSVPSSQKQNLTQTYAKYQMAIANDQSKNGVTKTDPSVLS